MGGALSCCSSSKVYNENFQFRNNPLSTSNKHVGSKGKSRRGSVYVLNEENISKAYIFKEILGAGYYGTVKLGVPINDTNKKYAIKSINKEKIAESKINQLTREIKTLLEVDHPYIVKYYETYDDEKFIHIVMEYCTGGELLDRIIEKKYFSEKEAAEVIYKITSAISHCHSLGIVHRDLKPENILYESKSDFSDLKIIDFGLATKIESGVSLNSVVGSPYYVSPEVLDGKYDEKCDVWSIGILCFVLLTGNPPFYSSDRNELYHKIREEEPDYNNSRWNKVSVEAKKLIKSLLVKNPSKRPSCEDILNSPWILAFTKGKYNYQMLDKEVIKNLTNFNEKSQLAKSILKYVVKSISSQKMEKLKHQFNILDKNKTGFITIDQLKLAFSYCEINIDNDELLSIFKRKIDNKGDHKLNYTSFIALALDEQMTTNREILWEAFTHFDSKSKGYLSIDDFKLALDRSCKTRSYDNIVNMFKEVGLKKDEKIDFERFCSLLTDKKLEEKIDIRLLSSL